MRKKLSELALLTEARRQKEENGDFTITSLAKEFGVHTGNVSIYIDNVMGLRSRLEILRGWALCVDARPLSTKVTCDWVCLAWLARRFALPAEQRGLQFPLRWS